MLKNEDKYYLYCLYCPIAKEVKYVGITNNLKARFGLHQKNYKGVYANIKKYDWVKSLNDLGLNPIMRVLKIIDGYENALNEEKRLIFKWSFRRELVNKEIRPFKKFTASVALFQREIESLNFYLNNNDIQLQDRGIIENNIYLLEQCISNINSLKTYK